MRKLSFVVLSLALSVAFASGLWAQCVELEGDPAVDVPFDVVKAESTQTGVTYLSLIGGDTPVPNDCGLNPSNDPGEWTGWGGPLDTDNVTIGEGAGTRNPIIIGGVFYERGLGAHAVGTFVYDLTGGNYGTLDCYVGMADEKDPDECGHGGSSDFIFSLDGTEVFATGTHLGFTDGVNTPPERVTIDITGASELTIVMGDGGDGNSCDHSAIGDPKLLAVGLTAVDPDDSLSTTWGKIKSR